MVLTDITMEFTMKLDDDLFSGYLEELDRELDKQSDRAISLVCCSILEELLKEKVKRSLISDKATDKLFEGSGPFGTAYNRTISAYCMGLITENQKKNLSYMQNVRNKFAHQIVGLSFESPQIKDICSNLEIPKNMYMPHNIAYKKTAKENGITVEKDVYINTNPYETSVSTKQKYIIMFNYLYDVLRPFEHNYVTPAAESLPHERIQRIINYYEQEIELLKKNIEDSETKEMIKTLELSLINIREDIIQMKDVLIDNYT